MSGNYLLFGMSANFLVILYFFGGICKQLDAAHFCLTNINYFVIVFASRFVLLAIYLNTSLYTILDCRRPPICTYPYVIQKASVCNNNLHIILIFLIDSAKRRRKNKNWPNIEVAFQIANYHAKNTKKKKKTTEWNVLKKLQ